MKLEITIPENWSEVKLKDYQEYMKAIKPYEKVENYELIMLQKAINHFCNIDTEQLHKLPVENYHGLIAYMSELLSNGYSAPLVKSFTLGDIKYGFIPSLDKMTYGEYLDLTTYFKDMWPNMTTIMSILYRPVTKEDRGTYDIQAYNGTDEEIENIFNHSLAMDIVWGAIGFFLSLQKDLLSGMVTYLTQTLKEMTKKDSRLLEILTKNGADISQLQYLQETILQSSKPLQSSTSTSV
jgi:hypothetical protein